MGPWDFLLKPTNIIISALLIALGLSGGIAYYMYHQNITLHEQLAVQKRENQIYVDTHNQQIKELTATIDGQNTSIDAFKKSGDKQVAEMNKVQTKVDEMRITAEQQLAELRKKNTANYTCDQSIQFLVEQSKVLTWGAAK
jgi:uncharacterized protein HemX